MSCRARPLLGTFVSIRTDGDDSAVEAAFAAIEKVQGLMSPQEHESDLSRINRGAHRRPVEVHPWTFAVLRCARAMSRASAGIFDITEGRFGARHEDVELIEGRRVRLRSRARLDLGGIAKGFAVDRGVEVLRRHGARRGSVNAGGDLRAFGEPAPPIRVRAPGALGTALHLGRASERAYATSAGYFGSEIWDARAARRTRLQASITVSAPTCVVADALTKVIAICGPRRALLARFRAEAFLVDDTGALYAARP